VNVFLVLQLLRFNVVLQNYIIQQLQKNTFSPNISRNISRLLATMFLVGLCSQPFRNRSNTSNWQKLRRTKVISNN